ncbi:MAG: PH domain-containing protein, partial [Planctomycetota bacterium JB042]
MADGAGAREGLRRLHPATVLLEIPATVLKWGWPIVAAGFLFGGGSPSTNVVKWAVIGIVFGAVSTLFRYFTLRFGIVGERLVLRHGLIWTVDRTIPLDRIQNVDLKSSPIQRLFGVTTVRIETAGADDTEASLSVVSEEVAERFRDDLLERRAAPSGRPREPEAKDAPEEEVIRRLGFGELLLAGATENRVGVIVAALFGLLELLDEGTLDLEGPLELALGRAASAGPWLAGALAVALVLTFLVAGWVTSILLTALRFHGFELRRSGEGVRRRHGLLSKYESLVRRDRLQVFLLEANLLRRLVGYVTLKVQTAGSGEKGEAGGSAVFFPLLPRREADGLMRLVLPHGSRADLDLDSLRPVHPRAARRIFLRLCLLSALCGGFVALAAQDPRGLLVVPVGVLLAFALRGPQYRALKWNVTDSTVIARAGLWTRRLWVVPRR